VSSKAFPLHAAKGPSEQQIVVGAVRHLGGGGTEDDEAQAERPIVGQCHGNNVGEMGTLRGGNGGLTGGVPFVVNAAESTARKDHARESDTARCLDGTGGFAANQGGTVVAFSSKDYGGDAGPDAPTLRAGGHDASHVNGGVPPAVFVTSGPKMFDAAGIHRERIATDVTPTISAFEQPMVGGRGVGSVRRLTPTECERLQAFPDGWTCLCGAQPYSTASCRCPDGPRYRAMGNAVTVSVVEWIGRRLATASADVTVDPREWAREHAPHWVDSGETGAAPEVCP